MPRKDKDAQTVEFHALTAELTAEYKDVATVEQVRRVRLDLPDHPWLNYITIDLSRGSVTIAPRLADEERTAPVVEIVADGGFRIYG